MSTATMPRTEIRCQNCPAVFQGSRTVDLGMSDAGGARVAGWIVWSGTTIGGREESRTFCPRCAGRTPEPEEVEPGWDAVCDTCDAQASEDWSDEVPLSEEDVDAWKSDHRCEPYIRKIRPEVAGVSP